MGMTFISPAGVRTCFEGVEWILAISAGEPFSLFMASISLLGVAGDSGTGRTEDWRSVFDKFRG